MLLQNSSTSQLAPIPAPSSFGTKENKKQAGGEEQEEEEKRNLPIPRLPSPVFRERLEQRALD